MRKFEKYEIDILGSYWERLKEFEKVPQSEQSAHMKKIVEGLNELYPTLDDDLKKIVQMRYWDKEECYEWEDIADEIGYSRTRTLRKRNVLLNKTADAIGFI